MSKKILAIVLIFSVAGMPVYGQEYRVRECRDVSEERLREELLRQAQNALYSEVGTTQVQQAFNRQWYARGVEAVIDQEVDRVIEQLEENYSFWDLVKSNWNGALIETLAEQAAKGLLESETLENALNTVASETSSSLLDLMQKGHERSTSNVIHCVDSYIGHRYSGSIGEAFQGDLAGDLQRFATDLGVAGPPGPSSGIHGPFAAVAGGYIARAILTQLAKTLRNRAAATVARGLAGAVVPVINILVALHVLKDLPRLMRGALPYIEEHLKSAEFKADLRGTIAKDLSELLRGQLVTSAETIANAIYESWSDFLRKHRLVLRLADRNPRFHTFLGDLRADELERAGRLVALLQSTFKEDLDQKVSEGAFEVLFDLPDAVHPVLEGTGSVDATKAWYEVAGDDRIARVVELKLWHFKAPDDLSPAMLEKLLNLESSPLVQRIAALDRLHLESLLGLPVDDLALFAEVLEGADLESLSWLLRMLPQEHWQPALEILRGDPSQIAELADPETRQEIRGSDDRVQAVMEILDPGNPLLGYVLVLLLLTAVLVGWWRFRARP